MSKFRVQRKASLWLEVIIEADSEQEARKKGETQEELWDEAEEAEYSFLFDDMEDLWVEEIKAVEL